ICSPGDVRSTGRNRVHHRTPGSARGVCLLAGTPGQGGRPASRGGVAMSQPSPIVLAEIAHGRSGDKGNHANVAVLAYNEQGYQWLRDHLTAEVVGVYFRPLGPSRVVRFEAANVLGLNFVLYDVLAGGASRSLRTDSQGKTLALALLQMPIDP